jgi:hypothetical protein
VRTVQDTFASLRRLPSFSLPSLYGQSRHPYNLGLNLRNFQIKYLYTFLALTKLQLLEMGGNDCVKSEFKDPNICLRLSTLHFSHTDTLRYLAGTILVQCTFTPKLFWCFSQSIPATMLQGRWKAPRRGSLNLLFGCLLLCMGIRLQPTHAEGHESVFVPGVWLDDERAKCLDGSKPG